MTIDRTDIHEPLEADRESAGTYDLQAVTGDELVRQRVRRGLLTSPGELVHRPEWGAGLIEYQNETATLSRRQELVQQADRFIKSLAFVDDHQVAVTESDDGAFLIRVTVEVDGRELSLPDITV